MNESSALTMTAQPTPDPANVDRSDLLRRVFDSNARYVAITAAAGYGKSRFARALMAAHGHGEVADAADMVSVPTAVRALVRAMGPFEAEFADRQSRFVLALPRDGSADLRWRDVLDEALDRDGGSATLCVENGECLAERPDIAALVDRALGHPKRRAILCSRIPLALPSIARIPPNERYDIGEADLRFRDDEVRRLFAPFAVPAADLRRATDLARGWPIAVLTFLRAAREGRLSAALALAAGLGMETIEDYTLRQGLGSLSNDAREVLAAAAIVGPISDEDLVGMTADPDAVRRELDLCPFVSSADGRREVHPLAIAALRSMRATGERVLARAAANARDPIRAAQLHLAAGDPDRAADVLDEFVAPFMMEDPTPEVAALVASLPQTVLVRHPATWNATWMNRGYSVPSQRMLFESRTVWASLTDATPIEVRFGVGLSLLNWLFFLGHAGEAEPVFVQLEEALAPQPAASPMRLLVAAHRELAKLRQGKATAWEAIGPAWDAAFGSLPMVAAMAHYALNGPLAFFQGDRAGSRRAFALGVDLAATGTSETVHVIAIKNAAFFAWLAGEDVLFSSLVEALAGASAPNVAEATRHFLGCATSEAPSSTLPGYELPVYRAYAWLIAAARERSGAGRRAALRAAVDAATEDGQPWLHALTLAALGTADPDARERAFERSRAIAATIEYPVFREALADVLRGAIPRAWAGLRALAGEPQPEATIVVSLLAREVRVGSRTITLAPRESELLLALALHRAPRDRATLAAMIWPDVDDARASIVGVYVSRLRQRLGDIDLIEAGPSGYGLRRPVLVDLFLLEDAIRERRATEPLDPALEALVSSQHVRLPQWVLTSTWLLPYARRFEEAVERIRATRATVAAERGDLELMRHYRTLLEAEQHDR